MYDVMIPVTLQRYQTDQKYIYIIQIRFENHTNYLEFGHKRQVTKKTRSFFEYCEKSQCIVIWR